jgi:hypothetical protein
MLPAWSGGTACGGAARLALQVGDTHLCAALRRRDADFDFVVQVGDVLSLHWSALRHDAASLALLVTLCADATTLACDYVVHSLDMHPIDDNDFQVRQLHLEPHKRTSAAAAAAALRFDDQRLVGWSDQRASIGLFRGAVAERALADALVRAGCFDAAQCRVPRCSSSSASSGLIRFPLGMLECRSNRVVRVTIESRAVSLSLALCLWCDALESDRDSELLATHLSELSLNDVAVNQLALGGNWPSLDLLAIVNATVGELALRMSAPLLAQFVWSNVTGTRLPLRAVPPQVLLVDVGGAVDAGAGSGDGPLVLPLLHAIRLSVGGTGATGLDLTHCVQLTHLRIANEPRLTSVALSPRVRLAALVLDAVPHLSALDLAHALAHREFAPLLRPQPSPSASALSWGWWSAPALPSRPSAMPSPATEPVVRYSLAWLVTLLASVALSVVAGWFCLARK